MKYAEILIAIAAASPALAQEYACEGWSTPGYQEGGPISAVITEGRLTWSNGRVISEAVLIHQGRSAGGQVFAEGNTLYIVTGRSTVDLRRVNMVGAEPDSTTSCVAPDS